MKNLLTETKMILASHGLTPSDVVWIGDHEIYFTWSHFELIADREYDNGFGTQEVATALLVVGEDFWLERHEYDGSEWWEFKQLPKMPAQLKKITTIFGSSYDSLLEMNKEHEP